MAFVLSFMSLHDFGKQSGGLAVAKQVVQSACIAAAGPNMAFVLSFMSLHDFGKQSGGLAVAKQVVQSACIADLALDLQTQWQ
jgi:hypothetical protein